MTDDQVATLATSLAIALYFLATLACLSYGAWVYMGGL
jgi:hypothetical protein